MSAKNSPSTTTMLTIPCYFVGKAAGDKNRFLVCEQRANGFVYGLLESVHGKLQRSKHDVDFDDLLLFKPETNLQTEPEETLLERARSDLHGRSKNSALPVSHHLSAHFAGDLDMGTIQVLVATKAFFEPGDVKMDDTVAHDTMDVDVVPRDPGSNFFEAVYNILWHNKFPDGIASFDPFSQSRVIDFSPLGGVTSAYPSFHHLPLIIRSEYQELYRDVEEIGNGLKQHPKSLLLLGHPGIGKTSALFYLLCRCFQNKQPVYLQAEDAIIYFFCEDGISRLPSQSYRDHRQHRSAGELHWYLVDINSWQKECRVDGVSRTVAIIASSPAKRHYKDWEKYADSQRWWMQPWAMEELMDVVELLGFDPEIVGRVFTRHGGSARLCFGPKSKQTQADMEQDTAINKIIKDSIPLDEYPTADEEASSRVVALVPKATSVGVDREQFVTMFTSPYVATQVMTRAKRSYVAAIVSFYQELYRHTFSRTAAGWLFEGFAHRILSRGLQPAKLRLLSPRRTKAQPHPVPSSSAFTEGRLNELISVSIPGSEPSWIQAIAGSEIDISPCKYLLPVSKNQVGFDSLFLDDDGYLNIFQITFNTQHRFNPHCLEQIPDHHYSKMRLIFVMPTEEAQVMAKQSIIVVEGKGQREEAGKGEEMGEQRGKGEGVTTLAKKIPQFVLEITEMQLREVV